MKKLLSILLILTLNINLIKSQDANYDGSVNLVEENLDVYVGEELILVFDTTFYNNTRKYPQNFDGPPLLKNYKKSNKRKSNIYLPFEKGIGGEWKTHYNLLVGKHFKVLSIKEVQKRDKVEKYFELLLKETDEILFVKTNKTYTKDLFFPFFVVKHFEYLKQTFINKRFLGVSFDKDPHPDRGTTKHFFNKISGLTMPWQDTWICKDIKLDMKKNPLIWVLTNNKQDVEIRMEEHSVFKFFFENKEISFCSITNGCYGKQFYQLYNYTPEPLLCNELENPLDCYQYKISSWVSDFHQQNDYPNFNFSGFEIVGFSNGLILEDDNNNKTIIYEYILKRFLKDEYDKPELRELIQLAQEKSFKLAQEKDKVMEIFNIYPSSPNSATGVSFSIDWFYYNTKKEIKYIYFTVVPYNAVGDRQYCDIRNYAIFTGSATGPISASSRPTEYNWENAWYNSTIDSLEIIKVQIEYMDGTSYTFVKELKNIISPYFNK